MNDNCRRYAEDPEANVAHLRDCVACRQIYGMLDVPVESQSVRVDALPLAPWEGAGYRSWTLAIAGSVGLLAIAIALCAAAKISPIRAVMSGMSSPQLNALILAGAEALRGASRVLQVLYGCGFVIVNTFLALLLRRAPRGIDA